MDIRLSAGEAPTWVDPTEYPFISRFAETALGRLHYVDEGAGEPIVFVHGNPSWSFMYRRLIVGLRSRYRCVAIDHLGFGLSSKPNEPCSPAVHAANLAALIEKLGLQNVTLVIHDWGGPIGMAYAVSAPGNVKRLIVSNTTVWSLKGVAGAERFARFIGSPIGHFLCRYLNAFPRFVMPSVFGDRAKLTKEIHRHYVMPFAASSSREGPWRLGKSLIGESDWMEAIWSKRSRLAEKPVLILAGGKDPTFGPEKLARWQAAFPGNVTHAYPGVGHFVAEEMGDEAVGPVRAFLNRASKKRRAP